MKLFLLGKKGSFLLVFSLVVATSLIAIAQTDPYYQLPANRLERNSATFPNLKSHLVKIYIRPEGGLYLQGSSLTGELSNRLQMTREVNMNWGLSVGFNYRDRWLIDVGYLQTPLSLTNTFSISPFSIPSNQETNVHSIPVRFQRNIWTIDRVARSTRLFVGGAIVPSLNGGADQSLTQRAFLSRTSSGQLPDTLRLTNRTTLKSIPVQAEAFIELRGKLIEALEIGTFVKIQTTFSSPLESEISLSRNRQAPEIALQKSKPYALRFGISVHYNFGIIRKYESQVK